LIVATPSLTVVDLLSNAVGVDRYFFGDLPAAGDTLDASELALVLSLAADAVRRGPCRR
jgi:hypothetical protein